MAINSLSTLGYTVIAKWNFDIRVDRRRSLADNVLVNLDVETVLVDAASPQSPATPQGTGDDTRLRGISRRRVLKALAGIGVAGAVTGLYSITVEPFWPEFHGIELPIRNLPRAFDGYRITHLTDTHAGDATPLSYLNRVIDRVNEGRPDLVLFTGDLTTHDMDYVDPGCALLKRLQAPVIASLGNHDYDTDCACVGIGTRMAEKISTTLASFGGRVLRNASTYIQRDGQTLYIAGCEDLMTGLLDVDRALADVPAGAACIMLSHNPDSVPQVDHPRVNLVLSGHTHGGQVRIPGLGAPLLPIRLRQYDAGLFSLRHTQLYVSRGVGCLRRIRLFCRPEIPTFVLRAA